MAYNVTITYAGPASPEHIMFECPSCKLHVPSSAYVDTVAYKGTVYDTNVEGFGKIDLMEPFASTAFPFPVPFSQFKLAIIGEDVKNEEGEATGAKKVTFKVDTYMEAFFYKEAGVALADQGFTVEVTSDDSEGVGSSPVVDG